MHVSAEVSIGGRTLSLVQFLRLDYDAAVASLTGAVAADPSQVQWRELLEREQVRAPFLNQLAIAWIQFMLEGWVRHRQAEFSQADPIRVPLADDDPIRLRYGQDALLFRRT